MIVTTIELRKLVASDGMTLTDGETLAKEVYLGKYDNSTNWYEITDAEAEEKLKEQEAELENVLSE